MKIKWLRLAVQDLVDHAEFIARDNAVAAGKEFLRVEAAVELLADNPLMGRPSALPDVRELVVAKTPYIVPYRIKNDQIEVLAVFHGAQDRARQLKRRRAESE